MPVVLSAVAVLAFAAGFGLSTANGYEFGQKFRNLLAIVGQPQWEAYQEQYQSSEEDSSYLLFFRKGEPVDQRTEYLASNLGVKVVEPTVFARGIVISVREPASEFVKTLRELPFVWMVLRDRPFFFCH